MSYLVLARKYRPQNFDELVGQAHITAILRKSIESGRIAHAFLFCGPRGIGKTSCARILAKSLNCAEGPTLKPCGECQPCREITNTNSFDVIEIDGASNRGIDEIRTLRENVKFAPGYARYKIYIIDEVHMLTSDAFNALLKTLEEPPEHVKFIFATTEVQKVPATILSRCQRFDFKRIQNEVIMANLKSICVQEAFKVDEEALFAVAKASQGSMRDALGILDQLSALSDKGIDVADVFSMLGMVETEFLFDLTDALIARNCAKSLDVFNQVIDRGKDIRQLSKDLTEHFRHLMIAKVGGAGLNALIDYPAAVKQRLAAQAEKITIAGILKAIELFIEAQENARVMENLRMPLEVAFAKLTYGGASGVISSTPPAAPSTIAVKPVAAAPAARGQTVAPAPPKVFIKAESLEEIRRHWNELTHEVSRRKMAVATYLQEGAPCEFKAGRLVIAFPKESVFAKDCLNTKENLKFLEELFSERLNCPVSISFKTAEKSAPVIKQEEPAVRAALEAFGGKVVREWPNTRP
ncbi:MAG: DNA polymerase III subunit gamma/tau [Candidatus Omnitrophica bacterium]|nr:DNA polymerase III subunit gamma/tau [Candidatus Omnitrophota bacterium]MDE2008865.1 DNA polymerase III subunit gamma/tau [Candidatus Omnitrophota bacterium]MDE2213572.1 DNA polymerase III subunit gamma/tau [Candidatus Omnitrophota bacterium]MDE2230527.1 DNA polymerase III subunit gamma/tau [Candidatus Omnitrophota bacterium]